ncbi:hypothetical protein CASFOL_035208 [Castilleja foliolosa]|uniref:Uncharacterized protein n=1 Tax=Castilleja foliolosa TaxID=1961234 RepID=A0ABD3BT66_9LAMI
MDFKKGHQKVTKQQGKRLTVTKVATGGRDRGGSNDGFGSEIVALEERDDGSSEVRDLAYFQEPGKLAVDYDKEYEKSSHVRFNGFSRETE